MAAWSPDDDPVKGITIGCLIAAIIWTILIPVIIYFGFHV